MLWHYISYRQDNWAQFLTPLEIAYNQSINPSTGYSPFELDCGRQPTMPHNLLNMDDISRFAGVNEFIEKLVTDATAAQDAIRNAQEIQAQYHNQKRRHITFHTGNRVLVSAKHINPPWNNKSKVQKLRAPRIGPFKVIAITKNACTLELPPTMCIHNTINNEFLKPYKESPDQFSRRIPRPDPPVEIGD